MSLWDRSRNVSLCLGRAQSKAKTSKVFKVLRCQCGHCCRWCYLHHGFSLSLSLSLALSLSLSLSLAGLALRRFTETPFAAYSNGIHRKSRTDKHEIKTVRGNVCKSSGLWSLLFVSKTLRASVSTTFTVTAPGVTIWVAFTKCHHIISAKSNLSHIAWF